MRGRGGGGNACDGEGTCKNDDRLRGEGGKVCGGGSACKKDEG